MFSSQYLTLSTFRRLIFGSFTPIVFFLRALARSASTTYNTLLASPCNGLIALCLLSAFLSGCGGMYRVNSVFKTGMLPSTYEDKDKDDFYLKDKQQIDTDSAAFRSEFLSAHAVSSVPATETQGEENRAKGARNALISKILLLADDVCLQHKADIQGNATGVNLSLGTATTLFSGAGALATGAGAATLSALAAASNSTRSLINAEVYQQTLSASILLAIDGDRVAKKVPIIAGMKSSTTDYPIEVAIQQISEYHQSCSFVSGIEVISKAVQQRPKTKAQIQSDIDYLTASINTNDSGKAELEKERTRLQLLLQNAPQ